jgi:hypothetical protein
VTLRARWVTLRARWVTLRARWVTLRARGVTLRARWVTFTEPAVGFTKAHGKAYERQYLTAEHCHHMVSNYTSALYNVDVPKAHGLNYAYGTMSVRPLTRDRESAELRCGARLSETGTRRAQGRSHTSPSESELMGVGEAV